MIDESENSDGENLSGDDLLQLIITGGHRDEVEKMAFQHSTEEGDLTLYGQSAAVERVASQLVRSSEEFKRHRMEQDTTAKAQTKTAKWGFVQAVIVALVGLTGTMFGVWWKGSQDQRWLVVEEIRPHPTKPTRLISSINAIEYVLPVNTRWLDPGNTSGPGQPVPVPVGDDTFVVSFEAQLSHGGAVELVRSQGRRFSINQIPTQVEVQIIEDPNSNSSEVIEIRYRIY